VIDNSGTPEELEWRVDEVWQELSARAGSDCPGKAAGSASPTGPGSAEHGPAAGDPGHGPDTKR